MESREAFIKRTAKELGFSFCGISKAEFLRDEEPRLARWLEKGMNGKMAYMEGHFDKRLDPTKLVPGAKSVVSLLFNYHTDKKQKDGDAPKISRYAYGEDYHFVVKRKLKSFLKCIEEEVGAVHGRAFVDSAPVLDKAWAAKSGLGWIGKNANLINKQQGSFFFIAELIIDLELDPDGPIPDYCGSCTRCIDACPTDAIVDPYVVDGSRCISYFTIELKEQIPLEVAGKFDQWAFGCDICQEVCPWNRFSKLHDEPAFDMSRELFNLSKKEWEELSEETFQEIFRHSPVKRTGFEGLKRNVKFLGIKGNSMDGNLD